MSSHSLPPILSLCYTTLYSLKKLGVRGIGRKEGAGGHCWVTYREHLSFVTVPLTSTSQKWSSKYVTLDFLAIVCISSVF